MAKPSRYRVVLDALENERALDVRYRSAVAEPVPPFFPNYKVMKLLSLRRQLGAAIRPAVALAPVAVAALAPGQWVLAFGASLAPKKGDDARLHILATTPRNVALIRGALESDADVHDLPADELVLGLVSIAKRVNPSDVARAIGDHIQLMATVLRMQPAERRDLALHSIDAPAALLLARYLERESAGVFVTDCHYQRWSYIVTAMADDARLVQHGVLDTEVSLPHSGNRVGKAYVRDAASAEHFARYYHVDRSKPFSWLPSLSANPYSESGVFLASSFPFIDEEIAVLRRLRKAGVPILVKLHPAHRYDGRKRELLSLANHVCGPTEDPACRAFVSHSSSMEREYAARGIPTVSIAHMGVEAASEALLALLSAPREPLAKPPLTTQD